MPSWGNAASFSLLRNGNGEDPAITLLAAAFFSRSGPTIGHFEVFFVRGLGTEFSKSLAESVRDWGVSQENLTYYIGFFEFAHNTKARSKSLLKIMLQIFLSPPCKPA